MHCDGDLLMLIQRVYSVHYQLALIGRCEEVGQLYGGSLSSQMSMLTAWVRSSSAHTYLSFWILIIRWLVLQSPCKDSCSTSTPSPSYYADRAPYPSSHCRLEISRRVDWGLLLLILLWDIHLLRTEMSRRGIKMKYHMIGLEIYECMGGILGEG